MRKRHKYGSKITEVDGIRFHSKKEAKRYQELKLLERAGEIRDLQLQPNFPLNDSNINIKTPTGRTMKYIADFKYITAGGTLIIEDVKGYDNQLGQVKRAVFEAIYKIPVTLI